MNNRLIVDETLIIRYFSGDVTPEEREAVKKWLEASEENQLVAQRAYYIMYAGGTVQTMRSIDARAGLDKVWKRIRKRSRRAQTIWIQRAAAAACLLLLSTLIFLQLRDTRHSGLAAV